MSPDELRKLKSFFFAGGWGIAYGVCLLHGGMCSLIFFLIPDHASPPPMGAKLLVVWELLAVLICHLVVRGLPRLNRKVAHMRGVGDKNG